MKMILISHRGDTSVGLENSMLAFRSAVEKGYKTLETDLRATSDGDIILCHDLSLERLGGSQEPVQNRSRTDLVEETQSWAQPVCFLDELLGEFDEAIHFVFDIKPESGSRVLEILSSDERFHSLASNDFFRCHFLFWEKSHEVDWRNKYPRAKFFASEGECRRADFSALLRVPWLGGIEKGKSYAIPPTYKGLNLFSRKMVEPFHKRGAKTIAYLPQNRAQEERAIEAGFDFLLTDFPRKDATGIAA